uniref:Serk2 n=1 Tax=Arundo donax TaxID=35708 RepID=A0A0A9DYX5_ARUDO
MDLWVLLSRYIKEMLLRFPAPPPCKPNCRNSK